jgi:hypothetical protein
MKARGKWALLGANEGDDLLGGVELDPETPAVPVGGHLTEAAQAGIGRVLVRGRVLGRLAEGLYDVGRGGLVRVAHAQVDDIHAAGAHLVAQAVDLLEEIRRQKLQALGALMAHGKPRQG